MTRCRDHGTQVLSDWLVVRITASAGETFLDRIDRHGRGARRRKTPNEIRAQYSLGGAASSVLLSPVTLLPFSLYSRACCRGRGADYGHGAGGPYWFVSSRRRSALLSAIGIAGMDRMSRANVIAHVGESCQAANVDVLLLDKTGTITLLGNRRTHGIYSEEGVTRNVTMTTMQRSWPRSPIRCRGRNIAY